jgi:hypothetical protein
MDGQGLMKTLTNFLKGALFAGLWASAPIAAAQEAPASVSTDEVEVLSLEDMDALAGGDGVNTNVITEQTLNAVNTGNTVAGDVVGSGQVTLGSGAFSGYAGLGNFVINTGHNNNLQASMSVNVVLPPGTP